MPVFLVLYYVYASIIKDIRVPFSFPNTRTHSSKHVNIFVRRPDTLIVCTGITKLIGTALSEAEVSVEGMPRVCVRVCAWEFVGVRVKAKTAVHCPLLHINRDETHGG